MKETIKKNLFKIVVLAFFFLVTNAFGSFNINKKNPIVLFPLEVKALLLGGFPDFSGLNEIIAIQKEIFRPVRYDDNRKKIPKKAQKIFFEIRDALFPTYLFLQTCKYFYGDENLKIRIKEEAINILSSIFPQGIAFFYFQRVFKRLCMNQLLLLKH